MKKIILIAAILAFCSACTITTHYVQTNAKEYSSTNPETIKIFSNSDVLDNYVVIGSVASHAPGDGVKAVKELKKEAAKNRG